MTNATVRGAGFNPNVPGLASNLKSFATPIALTGNTSTSTSIASPSVTTGLVANGTYITGSGVPAGTYITAVGASLTLNQATTTTVSSDALTAYPLNTRTTTANSLVVSDVNGNSSTLLNVNVFATINNSGAGGLDTGTVAASTWYYEHVIWGPTVGQSKVFSLSATAPTLPTGYTMWARTYATRTDANKILLYTSQTGRNSQYVVNAGANVTLWPLMASGVQSNVPVALSSFVPPSAGMIRVIVENQTAGTYAGVGPNSSFTNTASPFNPVSVGVDSATGWTYQSATGGFLIESANIYYTSSAGAAYLYCIGWEDNL